MSVVAQGQLGHYQHSLIYDAFGFEEYEFFGFLHEFDGVYNRDQVCEILKIPSEYISPVFESVSLDESWDERNIHRSIAGWIFGFLAYAKKNYFLFDDIPNPDEFYGRLFRCFNIAGLDHVNSLVSVGYYKSKDANFCLMLVPCRKTTPGNVLKMVRAKCFQVVLKKPADLDRFFMATDGKLKYAAERISKRRSKETDSELDAEDLEVIEEGRARRRESEQSQISDSSCQGFVPVRFVDPKTLGEQLDTEQCVGMLEYLRGRFQEEGTDIFDILRQGTKLPRAPQSKSSKGQQDMMLSENTIKKLLTELTQKQEPSPSQESDEEETLPEFDIGRTNGKTLLELKKLRRIVLSGGLRNQKKFSRAEDEMEDPKSSALGQNIFGLNKLSHVDSVIQFNSETGNIFIIFHREDMKKEEQWRNIGLSGIKVVIPEDKDCWNLLFESCGGAIMSMQDDLEKITLDGEPIKRFVSAKLSDIPDIEVNLIIPGLYADVPVISRDSVLMSLAERVSRIISYRGNTRHNNCPVPRSLKNFVESRSITSTFLHASRDSRFYKKAKSSAPKTTEKRSTLSPICGGDDEAVTVEGTPRVIGNEQKVATSKKKGKSEKRVDTREELFFSIDSRKKPSKSEEENRRRFINSFIRELVQKGFRVTHLSEVSPEYQKVYAEAFESVYGPRRICRSRSSFRDMKW